jgi:hypothetical protein
MVLIPLLTLFLIASQLTISIHGRNMAKISAQDAASQRAITGNFQNSDTYLHIYSPDTNHNLDLVVSHEERLLPSIIPGLGQIIGRDQRIKVSGLAVVENQR